MPSSETALVRSDWQRGQQQVPIAIPDSRWLAKPALQEFTSFYHVTIKLLGALALASLFAWYSFAEGWVHHQNGSDWVVRENVYVHNAPDTSPRTRLGMLDEGTRVRVVGKRTGEKKTLYEIEILSPQPMWRPAARMWVSDDYVTLIRR